MNYDRKKIILLVEDQTSIATMEKQNLENEGYRVIHANTGENAIDIVCNKKEPVDLILMDIELGIGGMDGTRTAKEILKTHEIPIIFISSYIEKDVVQKTEKISSYGYVVKNSGITVLDASIKMAFKLFEAKMREKEKAYALEESKRHFEQLAKQNQTFLHLIQFSLEHSLEELLEETLNETEKITNSLIGFYHFVEDDQSSLTLQNWSTRTKAEFCKAQGKGSHYAISDAGVWVDCVYQKKPVIHNDYASLPHRKGMPEGHAKVTRELVVPVFRGKKIKAILGVGNKLTDYEQHDVETVSLIADLAWEIVERKRAEEQREQFLKFFQISSDIMVIADPNGSFKKVNPATLELLGYSETELISKPFIDFVHPDDKQSTLDEMVRQIKIGSSLNFENRYVCKNGTFRCLSWSADYNKNDGITYATARDITKRKVMEKELEESRILLKTIIEGTDDAIFVKDLNGRYLMANQATRNFLDKKEDDILGKDDSFLFSTEDAALIMDDDSRVIKEGQLLRYEENVSPSQDKKITFLATKGPIFDHEGNPMGLFGISRDITERKRAEEKIQKLLHEKELILKEVHHRIKNNMNTITSLLRIQSDTQNEPAIRNILQDAAGRIRSMMVLYDKLYRSVNTRDVYINEYFSSLIKEIFNIFPQKGEIKIKTQIDEDIILNADILSSLGIIFNELITNAMRYAFKGKTDGLITILASRKDNLVTIVVQDNGNGIPESVSFENSTGFGLMLVETLTHQIEGTIRIERENGTKFILEFDI